MAWSQLDFLAWGAVHGVVYILESRFKWFKIKLPAILRMAFTFLIVLAAWVFFRATSIENAFSIFSQLDHFELINFDKLFSSVLYGWYFCHFCGFNVSD